MNAVFGTPWVRVLFLLALLVGCSLGPGFLVARKLKWNPAEQLCASLGLSLLVLYLCSFVIFALHLAPAWHFLISGLCFLSLLLTFRDLMRLFGHAAVRRQISAFVFLLLWAGLLLSLVRHYSGGFSAGDWIEHYERSLFFLHHPSTDTRFLGMYLLPARPPLMNLVAANFLAQAGEQYYLFQLVFLFLNTLIVFPLSLLAGTMMTDGSRRVLLLTGLLAANPLFLQNATWTWTKLFTGFYVVFGIWLYLRAWRQRDFLRMLSAFVSLSTGFLIHYSAGPYGLFLTLHYLLGVFWKRNHKWRELCCLSVGCVALLATWFAWSMAVFGARATLTAHTNVDDIRKLYAGEYGPPAIATNIVNAVVPHPLRGDARRFVRAQFAQASRLSYLRDYVFLLYQKNLIVGMGSVGGLIVVYLMCRGCWSSSVAGSEFRRFWGPMALTVSAVGLAVSGGNKTGLANICLQPLMLMGVSFLAAQLPGLPRALRGIVLVGCAVDFVLGVFLHFSLQNRIFELVSSPTGQVLVRNGAELSQQAALNWGYKETRGMVFWGDHFSQPAGLQLVILLIFTLLLLQMSRQVMSATHGSHRPRTTGS